MNSAKSQIPRRFLIKRQEKSGNQMSRLQGSDTSPKKAIKSGNEHCKELNEPGGLINR